jgi:hypothetical protein
MPTIMLLVLASLGPLSSACAAAAEDADGDGDGDQGDIVNPDGTRSTTKSHTVSIEPGGFKVFEFVGYGNISVSLSTKSSTIYMMTVLPMFRSGQGRIEFHVDSATPIRIGVENLGTVRLEGTLVVDAPDTLPPKGQNADPECKPRVDDQWCEGDVRHICSFDDRANYTYHGASACSGTWGSGASCSNGECGCAANTKWCMTVDGNNPGVSRCGADGFVQAWVSCLPAPDRPLHPSVRAECQAICGI